MKNLTFHIINDPIFDIENLSLFSTMEFQKILIYARSKINVTLYSRIISHSTIKAKTCIFQLGLGTTMILESMLLD